jgi:deoxyinosine 3'endonuclease (endonuclease V)
VYKDHAVATLTVPYTPGYLGFREVPIYLQLLQHVAMTAWDPQVVMVNGYGQLHDRLCGSASQLGVQSGYATIGVAKSLLPSSQLQLDAEFDTWFTAHSQQMSLQQKHSTTRHQAAYNSMVKGILTSKQLEARL